jgi:hypothetical protein
MQAPRKQKPLLALLVRVMGIPPAPPRAKHLRILTVASVAWTKGARRSIRKTGRKESQFGPLAGTLVPLDRPLPMTPLLRNRPRIALTAIRDQGRSRPQSLVRSRPELRGKRGIPGSLRLPGRMPPSGTRSTYTRWQLPDEKSTRPWGRKILGRKTRQSYIMQLRISRLYQVCWA